MRGLRSRGGRLMPRLSTAYQAVLRSSIHSKKLNAVSWGAEALYFRLLCATDGAGRMAGDAFTVCAQVCTERMRDGGVDPAQVETFLEELESAQLIQRWLSKGEPYLALIGYFDAGNKQKVSTPEPPDMPPHPLVGDDSESIQTHPEPIKTTHPPDRGSESGDRGSGMREPESAAAPPPAAPQDNPTRATDPLAVPEPQSGRPPDVPERLWASWREKLHARVFEKLTIVAGRPWRTVMRGECNALAGFGLPPADGDRRTKRDRERLIERGSNIPVQRAFEWLEKLQDRCADKPKAYLDKALNGGPTPEEARSA